MDIKEIDAVELKCLLISKGVRVDSEIYRRFGNDFRIDPNPLTCNSMKLSEWTNVQLTDVESATPFFLKVTDDKPALYCDKDFVCYVTFHNKSDFNTRFI